MKNALTPIIDPNRHDWDFEGLPPDQLQDCLWYEYARQSPKIIKAVKTWRNWPRLKSTAPEQLGNSLVTQAMFSQSLGILTLCPEFPAKAWREILNSERVKRINQRRQFLTSFKMNIRRKAFQVLDPLAHQLRVEAMISRAKAHKEFPGFQDISGSGLQDIFCEIDFDQPVGAIIKDFRQWVLEAEDQQAKRRQEFEKWMGKKTTKQMLRDELNIRQLQPARKTQGQSPAKDRTIKTCRELLKALGAWRLLCHFKQTEPSQAKAIEHTQHVKGAPLYSSRESWLRAVKRAKEFLSQL